MFLNNLLGTQGLGTGQKLQAGLMAALPMVQHQGPNTFGGTLGGLFQGLGQARQWSGHQLPPAPNVAPFTPGQLPAPVPMPNIAPQAPGGSVGQMPSVLPPSPNAGNGIVDPRVAQYRGGMMNLGFGGGLGMGW